MQCLFIGKNKLFELLGRIVYGIGNAIRKSGSHGCLICDLPPIPISVYAAARIRFPSCPSVAFQYDEPGRKTGFSCRLPFLSNGDAFRLSVFVVVRFPCRARAKKSYPEML